MKWGVEFMFSSKELTQLPVGVGGIDEGSIESTEQDQSYCGSPVEIGEGV